MATVKGKSGFQKEQLNNLIRNLNKYPELDKQIQKTLFRGAIRVHTQIIESITGPASGRIVTRYDPKRTIQISAPGDPPKTDQGDLGRGITMPVYENGYIVIKSTAPYSLALEYGYEPNNLEPRPFMRPALKSKVPGIRNALRKQLNKFLQQFEG